MRKSEVIRFDDLLPETHLHILKFCCDADVPNVCLLSRKLNENVQVTYLQRGSIRSIPNLSCSRRSIIPTSTRQKACLIWEGLPLLIEHYIHSIRVSLKWSIDPNGLLPNHAKASVVVKDGDGKTVSECTQLSNGSILTVLKFPHRRGRSYFLSFELYDVQ